MDILVPMEEEGTTAVVRQWLKGIGDRVEADEPLVEIETDKVTMEVAAPGDGVITEILLDTDAEAPAGALLGRMETGGVAVAAKTEAPAAVTDPAVPAESVLFDPSSAMNTRYSPAVRRGLARHNLDPSHIKGTGRGGRITARDVEAAATSGGVSAKVPGMPVASTNPGRSRLIPHDRMRKSIADHMQTSVQTAPHVTAVFEADFSAIMRHRAAHKDAYAKQGVKLTYTAYIIAACVAAMREQPLINSRWHDDKLEVFDDFNIGIGTALGDKGLVVPVIHKAQELSLIGMAGKVHELTDKARNNRLRPADMRGGTFSISNHGVSGSLVATPIIINQPQSAILGVGKLEKRVVVREIEGADSIQIRPMAYVSLTIDHRVIDGHQTNAWLTTFVDTLESWPAHD